MLQVDFEIITHDPTGAILVSSFQKSEIFTDY